MDNSTFSCENIGINTITVTDGNGNVSTGTSVITVEDNLVPSLVSGQKLTVDEKSTKGTVVGSVAAGDNCSVQSFSISQGNTNNAFTIDAEGVVTVNNDLALDFETTPEYMLTVEVEDAAGNTSLEAIAILLNNVNDDAPVLVFLPDMAGDEMSLIRFTANAIVKDNAAGELQFSLKEGAPD